MDNSVAYYQTETELVQFVKIEQRQPYVNTAIYRLKLADLKKDDILSISTEFETTQDNGYVVQIGSYVVLSDYENCQTGLFIIKHNGFNINHEIHHGVPVHFRQYLIKEDMPGIHYLCTMLYPASKLAKSNDYLKIEQDSGHLDVMIYYKMQ
jgi:hypothetical protein